MDESSHAAIFIQNECLISVGSAALEQYAPHSDVLVVNISCPALADLPGLTIQVGVEVRGRKKLIGWLSQDRRTHAFLLDRHELGGIEHTVQVAIEPSDTSFPDAVSRLRLAMFAAEREQIVASLAGDTVFVFSTARSGSTWLGTDILGWKHRSRIVDEPGFGSLFAPLRWDAERFFNVQDLDYYIPAEPAMSLFGFSDLPIPETRLPLFSRANEYPSGPSSFIHKAYRGNFNFTVRNWILSNIISEWGVIDYDKVIVKSPNESHGADVILEAMPDARAIHLIRDGRDVMSSRFGAFGSGILANSQDPALRRHAIAFYSHFWNFQNDMIHYACARHDPNKVLRIRYEALRAAPIDRILELFGWLGWSLPENEHDSLLNHIDLANAPPGEVGFGKRRGDGTMGRFRSLFSADEIDLMNRIMGPVLQRYGYEI